MTQIIAQKVSNDVASFDSECDGRSQPRWLNLCSSQVIALPKKEFVNRLPAFRSGRRERAFFVLKLAQLPLGLAASPRSDPIIVLVRVSGHILYSAERIFLDCKLPTKGIVQNLTAIANRHVGRLKHIIVVYLKSSSGREDFSLNFPVIPLHSRVVVYLKLSSRQSINGKLQK